MKSICFGRKGLILALIGLAVGFGRAQTGSQLKIYPAVEVEFASEPGKAYRLESSSNLVDWSAVGEAFCGTGVPMNQLLASRSPAFKYYRLQILQTNCGNLLPRGLLLLGQPAHLSVALNLLGVGGLTPQTNAIPNANEAVLFTVSLVDGPMPQTREQIESVQGKQHGPAAILLVDSFLQDDVDLRALVLQETKELLKRYQQPGVDALPVLYDDSPTILNQVRELMLNGIPP